MDSTALDTMTALKEWAAAVHALLDGRQTILLRKGGIHERRFDVSHDRFVLFPTVAHSHAERVRAAHQDLLPLGAADVGEDAFTVRCGISLVSVVDVARPDRLDEVEDLHIWTPESIRTDRLEFRPKLPLQVLVVRAVALPEPVRVTRLPEHGGCRSWVEIGVRWDGRSGRQVHDEERLVHDADRVRATLGPM